MKELRRAKLVGVNRNPAFRNGRALARVVWLLGPLAAAPPRPVHMDGGLSLQRPGDEAENDVLGVTTAITTTGSRMMASRAVRARTSPRGGHGQTHLSGQTHPGPAPAHGGTSGVAGEYEESCSPIFLRTAIRELVVEKGPVSPWGRGTQGEEVAGEEAVSSTRRDWDHLVY